MKFQEMFFLFKVNHSYTNIYGEKKPVFVNIIRPNAHHCKPVLSDIKKTGRPSGKYLSSLRTEIKLGLKVVKPWSNIRKIYLEFHEVNRSFLSLTNPLAIADGPQLSRPSANFVRFRWKTQHAKLDSCSTTPPQASAAAPCRQAIRCKPSDLVDGLRRDIVTRRPDNVRFCSLDSVLSRRHSSFSVLLSLKVVPRPSANFGFPSFAVALPQTFWDFLTRFHDDRRFTSASPQTLASAAVLCRQPIRCQPSDLVPCCRAPS